MAENKLVTPYFPFSNFVSTLLDDDLFTSLPIISKKWVPKTEITDSDSHLIFSIDLPGISPDQLSLEIKNNKLIVSGQRTSQHSQEQKNKLIRTEKFYGSFSRSWALPNNVDHKNITSNFSNGVLSISVPYLDSPNTFRIPISH